MATLTLRTVVARPLTNQEVDDNFTSLNTESHTTITNVGVLSNLTTVQKGNVIRAINEIDSDVGNVISNVGVMTQLTTVNNSNIVVAVNELNTNVGNVIGLTTAVTDNLVAAVNDIYSKAIGNTSIDGGNIANVRITNSFAELISGNILFTGANSRIVVANINVTGGTISTSGNVSAGKFFGDGSSLSGISADQATRIRNGNTVIQSYFDGNVTANLGNVNIFVLDKSGNSANTTFYGNVSISSGNIILNNSNLRALGSSGILFDSGVISLVTGNVVLGTGNIVVNTGEVSIGTGNIRVSSGNLFLTSGSLALTSGDVQLGGNLRITGTQRKLLGDFSNASLPSRAMVQSSTTDGFTRFAAIPNGSNTQASFDAYNSATDVTNASFVRFGVTGTDARVETSSTGTGTNLPLTLLTSGVERVRVLATGNVGIRTTAPTSELSIVGTLNFGNSTGTAMSVSNDFGSNLFLTLAGGASGVKVVNNTNTSTHLTINNVGNVGIGTSSPLTRLSVLGTTYSSGYTQNIVALTVTTANANLDLSLADVFVANLTTNTTFTFINPPAANIFKNIVVILTQGVAGRTAAFINARYTDGVAPTLSTNVHSRDVMSFFTHDGGSFYYGSFVMAEVK